MHHIPLTTAFLHRLIWLILFFDDSSQWITSMDFISQNCQHSCVLKIWGSNISMLNIYLPRNFFNAEIGSVDEACKKKVTSIVPGTWLNCSVFYIVLKCIICWYGVVTTEQFTRLQTSFVVLGILLKSGCQHYNICRGEVSHYRLGTETSCRSSELFGPGSCS